MNFRIKILIVVCTTMSIKISSQKQIDKSFRFNNQSQIDSFKINNPSVEIVNGNIYIANEKFGDIVSLKAFENIIEIKGSLSILYTIDLKTLEGFENLKSVESLDITANRKLSTIDNFLSLTSISKAIKIAGNHEVSSIGFLSKIKPMPHHQIQITGNDKLESLQPLSQWEEVNSLRIASNDILSSLEGLNNLKVVHDALIIGPQVRVREITELEQLEYCGKFFFLSMNQIKDLNGLKHLKKIESHIDISDNRNLVNIEKLNEIEFGNEMEILIGWNKKLSNCYIESLCNYIDNYPTRFIFSGNDINCSVEHYKEMCVKK